MDVPAPKPEPRPEYPVTLYERPDQPDERLVRGPLVDPLGAEIRVRFRQDPDGRRTVTSLLVAHEAGLSRTLLQSIPFAAIDAALQQELREAAEDQEWWARWTEVFRAAQRRTTEEWARMHEERHGRALPDRFYREIAGLYNAAVRRGMSPAPTIAAMTDGKVPVRTVHGWIARARARGYLGAARKGRKG